MVIDALRGYLQLASGLTEVTRERARAAAKALVAQAESLGHTSGEGLGDTSAQVRALADDLTRTARTNRDLVLSMVRAETERAVGAVGMASSENVGALRRQVERLERRVQQLAPATAAPAKRPPAKAASTRTTPSRADKAATTKATVTKAVAKNASAKRAAATTKAAASRPTASKAGPAKRATATKAAAKNASAKRAAATKVTASRSTASKAGPAKRSTAPKKTAPKKRTATP